MWHAWPTGACWLAGHVSIAMAVAAWDGLAGLFDIKKEEKY